MTTQSTDRVRRPSRAALLGLSLGLSLPYACGDDGEESGESSESAGETEGDDAGLRVRGLSITDVSFNQGAEITIGEGDQWLALGSRNGRLLSDRAGVLGVRYALHPNWTARVIEFRLTLTDASGASTTMSEELRVTESVDPGYIDQMALFPISAELADSATAYRVEIFEAEEELVPSLEVEAWANPVDAPQLLGFEDQPMELEVQLVPVRATFGMDERVPAPTPEQLAEFTTLLYDFNPVTAVNLEVHEPVDFGGQPGAFGEVNALLQDLRVTDGAAENVYYIGLLDTGGPLLDNMMMSSGSASAAIAGPAKADAVDRVATLVYHPPDFSETLVHFGVVISKMQGRGTVACVISTPAGRDMDYPVSDGKLDAWGYSVSNGTHHAPGAHYDVASVCEPAWISRYGWNLVYDRVEALTAWSDE